MSYRKAKSLSKLLEQINAMAPRRSKSSDGWIGDEAHRDRESDHNPNDAGVVTAIDITHDPEGGCDCTKVTNALVKSRDKRIKYIIWNGRIINSKVSPWKWRTYSGSNQHKHHFHISVMADPALYGDVDDWVIPESKPRLLMLKKPPMRGDDVEQVQHVLIQSGYSLEPDGVYGVRTKNAVLTWQYQADLKADGIVGPVTRSEMGL
jgi:hypothetical protein